MSAKTVYTCNGRVCDLTTFSPEKDEWIVLDGILKAYQGEREGHENSGPIPYVGVEGHQHFCGIACLQSALEFPEVVEGEDASAEVGLPR